MYKIVQINSIVNSGSTGHIAEQIGQLIKKEGWESYIVYGRNNRSTESIGIKIGSKISIYFHVFITRLFNLHGLGSIFATKKLIKKLKNIQPDIVHLHCIHGYYINYKLLFKYLSEINIPVIMTFHDCWCFTGHCSHYEPIKCDKWKSCCRNCSSINTYPKSFLNLNVKKQFLLKKKMFTSIDNLTIITPSKWLTEETKQSFFKGYDIRTINNGIDLNVFRLLSEKDIEDEKQKYKKHVLLGVASVWTDKKGLSDFCKLNEILGDNYQLVLVGLSRKQVAMLPDSIIKIERTETQHDLVKLYNIADIYINMTYEDTFPTTNLEALACGTPVITYKTGGSTEIVEDGLGLVVEKGDVKGVREAVDTIMTMNIESIRNKCIQQAISKYNKNEKFAEYIKLYKELLKVV